MATIRSEKTILCKPSYLVKFNTQFKNDNIFEGWKGRSNIQSWITFVNKLM